MTNVSVIVGPTQSLSYNDEQPDMITINTSAPQLQSTYQILVDAVAKVKLFANMAGVTLTETTTTGSTGSTTTT